MSNFKNELKKRMHSNGELIGSSVFNGVFWLVAIYSFSGFDKIIDHAKVKNFTEVVNSFFNEQYSLVFLVFLFVVFALLFIISKLIIKDPLFDLILKGKAAEAIFSAVFVYCGVQGILFEKGLFYFLYYLALVMFPVLILVFNVEKEARKTS